ncbi:MAG: SDR family oxidoreductase [Parachlamydiales bacterium]|jgi:NADP-dependent 3-hydroxy acid dehydrogenase YdfG
MQKSGKKAILITGACGEIGKEIAKKFIKNGFDVCGIDIKNTPPEELIINANFSFCQVDISDYNNVSKFFKENSKRNFCMIVNCAGILKLNNSQETTISDWKSTLNVNLDGSFNIAKCGTMHFKNKGTAGMVILIGSRWGKTGTEKACAYASSKSGLRALVKSLQKENYETGIRFILLSPGSVLTSMSRAVDENIISHILKPSDIADLILYLSKTPKNIIFDEISIKAYPYDFINA